MHTCDSHNPYEGLASGELWEVIENTVRTFPFRAAAAVASSGFTTQDMHRLATHPDASMRWMAAESDKIGADDARVLLADEVEVVRVAVSRQPALPCEALLEAWHRGDLTRTQVARTPDPPLEALHEENFALMMEPELQQYVLRRACGPVEGVMTAAFEELLGPWTDFPVPVVGESYSEYFHRTGLAETSLRDNGPLR